MWTDQQRSEFEKITRPAIKWLNDNCNPHMSIEIDSDHAELKSGEICFHTEEYLKD
jgi:hypothetical protein